MTLSDELERLGELHRSGVLSEDEFTRAKARVLAGGPGAAPGRADAPLATINALRRSRRERWLGGVCGGIAEITGLAAWAWRLIFVVMCMFAGSGALLYLLLWVLLPDDEAPRYPDAGNLKPG